MGRQRAILRSGMEMNAADVVPFKHSHTYVQLMPRVAIQRCIIGLHLSSTFHSSRLYVVVVETRCGTPNLCRLLVGQFLRLVRLGQSHLGSQTVFRAPLLNTEFLRLSAETRRLQLVYMGQRHCLKTQRNVSRRGCGRNRWQM